MFAIFFFFWKIVKYSNERDWKEIALKNNATIQKRFDNRIVLFAKIPKNRHQNIAKITNKNKQEFIGRNFVCLHFVCSKLLVFLWQSYIVLYVGLFFLRCFGLFGNQETQQQQKTKHTNSIKKHCFDTTKTVEWLFLLVLCVFLIVCFRMPTNRRQKIKMLPKFCTKLTKKTTNQYHRQLHKTKNKTDTKKAKHSKQTKIQQKQR